jgi:ribosomal protein S18 acetylase RimI-like enzyme
MKNINLQRATAEDVGIFISLEKSVVGVKTYSGIVEEKEAREEIENNIVYLIKIEDDVVGNIEYNMEDEDTAYLGGLVILPDFQGQGIGREAIKQILEKIGDVKKINLVTHPHNTPAIKLYLSFGFVIDGWKDNYFGDGEPRIVMIKGK